MSSFIPDEAQSREASRSGSDNSGPEDDEPLSLEDGWDSREQDMVFTRRDDVRNRPRRASTIDLTGSEDDDLLAEGMPFVDLTDDEEVVPQPAHPERPTRNANLDDTHESLTKCTYEGMEFRINQTVELAEPLGLHHVQFVKIKSIHRDKVTQKVLLRGIAFTRAKFLKGMLPRKLNEVVAIWEVDDDDDRAPEEQALTNVRCEAVLNAKRELVVTNESFPMFRFEKNRYRTVKEVEEKGRLICRWQYYLHYRDARKRQAQKAHGWSLIYNTEADVPKSGHRQSDDKRLKHWRQGKVPGGSYPLKGESDPVVTIPDDDAENKPAPCPSPGPSKPAAGQRYTFGDMFCGAGGASRGAKMAGFKVMIAVDHWDKACNTYKLNFRDTKLHHMDVYDFVVGTKVENLTIDILHLSPPCQPYSPAHTVDGQHDDDNIAALFSCTELIKKIKPRLFTLEQTFGILHQKSMYYFAALVQGFTQHGYSVRWKVVHLKTWGLPQVRRRLIMIGSCPGEPLPPFPQPTHSEAGPRDGLQPLVTARQALATIPRDARNRMAARPRDLPSWNPDAPLPRTITTSGGQNYHYSGKRDLTDLEFAVLQGFPPTHRFCGPGVKKQIGNAFPPCVVKMLYDHLRKWLQKIDGVVPGPEVMDLTSDEDEDEDTSRPSAVDEVYRQYVGNLAEDEAIQRALRTSRQEASISAAEPMVFDLDGDEAERDRVASIEDEEDRMRRVEAQVARTSISSPPEEHRQANARAHVDVQEVVMVESDDESDSASDTLDGDSERSSMPPLRACSVASTVTLDSDHECHDVMSVDSDDDDEDEEVTYVGSSLVRMQGQVISLDD